MLLLTVRTMINLCCYVNKHWSVLRQFALDNKRLAYVPFFSNEWKWVSIGQTADYLTTWYISVFPRMPQKILQTSAQDKNWPWRKIWLHTGISAADYLLFATNISVLSNYLSFSMEGLVFSDVRSSSSHSYPVDWWNLFINLHIQPYC